MRKQYQILKQESSPHITIYKPEYYDDGKPYIVLECINDSMCLDVSSIPDLVNKLNKILNLLTSQI